jgi:hypothetical protein
MLGKSDSAELRPCRLGRAGTLHTGGMEERLCSLRRLEEYRHIPLLHIRDVLYYHSGGLVSRLPFLPVRVSGNWQMPK